MTETVRAIVWNVERKTPTVPTGAAAVARIVAENPDLVVLTEARHGHLDSTGGYEMASQVAPGDRYAIDERKVIAWSKHPWRDVDEVGDSDLPIGRFVAGTTETPIGPVRVIALCVPWHMSDVASGFHNTRPWEQHLDFLELLRPMIAASPSVPTVIAGDFNQRVPRQRGGRIDAAAALASTFDGWDIVTTGIPKGCDRQGIDHMAISSGLVADRVHGWRNDDGGIRMSDHDAVVGDLCLRV